MFSASRKLSRGFLNITIFYCAWLNTVLHDQNDDRIFTSVDFLSIIYTMEKMN